MDRGDPWMDASDASQTNPNGSFFRSATHTANANTLYVDVVVHPSIVTRGRGIVYVQTECIKSCKG